MAAKALVLLLVGALAASGEHPSTTQLLANTMEELMIHVNRNVCLLSQCLAAQRPLMTPGEHADIKYTTRTLVGLFQIIDQFREPIGWCLFVCFLN